MEMFFDGDAFRSVMQCGQSSNTKNMLYGMAACGGTCNGQPLASAGIVHRERQQTRIMFKWKRLPSMTTKRVGLALSWLENSSSSGYLYAIGGASHHQPHTVECIKVEAQPELPLEELEYVKEETLNATFAGRTWHSVAPMLFQRRDVSAVTTKGDVVIAGGISLDPKSVAPSEATHAVEMFSPSPYRHSDERWTRLSSLNTPRALMVLVLLGSGVVVVGELSVRSLRCNPFNKR